MIGRRAGRASRRRREVLALPASGRGSSRLHPGWRVQGLAFLPLLLLGCATTPQPPIGRSDLLSFLSDGRTTRQEVLTTLGQPSGVFEGERIFTYRVGYEAATQGYTIMGFALDYSYGRGVWPTWEGTRFSLVLVFDSSGVLQQHALVEVNRRPQSASSSWSFQ